jgi:CSLREA domain-containing protein
MPRNLRPVTCSTPLLVLSLLIGLMSLPDATNHLLDLLRPTARAANTFTVNSTGDGADSNLGDGSCNDGSGNCTLRAAIEQANAVAGSDSINFSIGSGVKTIVQTSDFPIISDPVVIDGTTQPGFAGTPIIEINGNASNRSNTNRSAFFITAGSSTLKGLVINRVNNAAIALITNSGNHIEGNYIGTDVTGSVRLPNSVGMIVNSSLNIIGGTTAGVRNVISGNNGTGIEFNTGAGLDNVIEGNYIGVNAAGTAPLGNSSEGIRVTGTGNRIGGTATGAGNVISGNGRSGLEVGGQMTTIQGNFVGTNAAGTAAIPNSDRGISIFNSPNNIIGGTSSAARNIISGNFGAGISLDESGSIGNVVQGNFIGTDVSGFAPLPNSPEGFGVPNTSGGVFINRGSNNLIGGSTAGAANTIAFNGGAGVWVLTLPNTSVGVGNHISRNFIYGNLRLGIDLGPAGVTPNDPGDSDTDANNLQNFPIITSVNTAGGSTTVNGTLGSAASTNYEVEFFANHGCHVSGNGEGARFLGTANVATDANGNAAFGVTLSSTLPAGQVVTATATDPSGNTSEFSPCNANGATGLVQFGATTMSVREDLSTLTIPVNRVGGSSGPLTVNFATANNTAVAGQDYTAVSGTLTFADGETSKTISLPIINDNVVEGSETMFVTLSSPATPAVVGALGVVVVRIWDSNTFPILSVIGTSVNEGNSGNKNTVVTVNLSIAIGQTVTVLYQTFSMTATVGLDFQPVSGMLTFAPGVTSQTVSVPIIGDTIDEPDETFRVGLFNAVNAGIAVSSNPPVVLIIDDDPAPAISVNDVGVIEGTSGTTNAVFTIFLSSQSSKGVSINYATADGTATAGADYQSASGTIVFAVGETSRTVTVLVNGDTVDEPLETFFLNLTSPLNATVADAQGVATIGTANSAGVKFSAATYSALETDHAAQIAVTRSGDASGAISVDYSTFDGTASERYDYTPAFGSLRFGAGEISKTFVVLLNEDAFVEGDETINLRLSNPTGGVFIAGPSTAPLVITDNPTPPVNPVDDAQFFVRQHYHDFLNREPDASGLAFWTNQITECQQPGAACDAQARRVNVSAAFYLSIEFQQTGYLVERIYKAAYGNAVGASTLGGSHQLSVPVVRLNEFLPDTQSIGQGVIVGQTGWETVLENNKQAFAAEFVQRSRFTTAYPVSLTAAQYVDTLNTNAGNPLSSAERNQLVNDLSTNAKTRAQVLRAVAEDADLTSAESNRAFVLMQYFGYLRRNPNDTPDPDYTGYDFWLTKLNQFNGNFVNAEMVKAFIVSDEYRQRFGP